MSILHSPQYQNIFNNGGLTAPDGMSLVWILKLHGHKHVDRVYGPDVILKVCERFQEQGYRHFFYGGKPGVADTLVTKLLERFPKLQIAGTYSPPFHTLTQEEDDSIIQRLNTAKPDIVWVGIGSPRQEAWMAEHVRVLNSPVLVGVGAAFDFLSGTKRQAPRWIQQIGMEWFFRLMTEPRRLWPRYSKYPKFAFLAVAQLLNLIDFPSQQAETIPLVKGNTRKD
jgi:N-acetylglucosaminyldiphosphoundecaprenol N-acetyl-beta-D-mannosaminyltransferase